MDPDVKCEVKWILYLPSDFQSSFIVANISEHFPPQPSVSVLINNDLSLSYRNGGKMAKIDILFFFTKTAEKP